METESRHLAAYFVNLFCTYKQNPSDIEVRHDTTFQNSDLGPDDGAKSCFTELLRE